MKIIKLLVISGLCYSLSASQNNNALMYLKHDGSVVEKNNLSSSKNPSAVIQTLSEIAGSEVLNEELSGGNLPQLEKPHTSALPSVGLPQPSNLSKDAGNRRSSQIVEHHIRQSTSNLEGMEEIDLYDINVNIKPEDIPLCDIGQLYDMGDEDPYRSEDAETARFSPDLGPSGAHDTFINVDIEPQDIASLDVNKSYCLTHDELYRSDSFKALCIPPYNLGDSLEDAAARFSPDFWPITAVRSEFINVIEPQDVASLDINKSSCTAHDELPYKSHSVEDIDMPEDSEDQYMPEDAEDQYISEDAETARFSA